MRLFFAVCFAAYLTPIHSSCDSEQNCDSTLNLELAVNPISGLSSCIKDPNGIFAWIYKKDSALQITPDCTVGGSSQSSSLLNTVNITGFSIVGDNNQYRIALAFDISIRSQALFGISLSRVGSSKSNCKTYKFHSPQSYSVYGGLVDECIIELQTQQSYLINVTSRFDNRSTLKSYHIFTPYSIHHSDSSVSADSWASVLVVGVDKSHVKVLLQPPPESHQYLLQFIYYKGSQVQLEESTERWLDEKTDVVSFDNPGVTNFNLRLLRCPHKDVDYPSCKLIQSHSFSASVRDLSHEGLNASPMESTSDSSGVEVIKDRESGIQKTDLIILLTTVFGVVFLVLVVAIILFIYLRRRSHTNDGPPTSNFLDGRSYEGLLIEEDVKGQTPAVLLLYSYDSQHHLSCVQSLALLLQNDLGCIVYTDFWSSQEMAERGAMLWLESKLAVVNYVIVICSTGARFKCASNRRARFQTDTDDFFLSSINSVMCHSLDHGYQTMAVYFDYSSESDIPPLLESWPQFKLPGELDVFLLTISNNYSKDKKDLYNLLCTSDLNKCIDSAARYMTSNPDWFLINFKPPTLDSRKNKTTADDESSPVNDKPLQVVTVEHSVSSRDACSQQSDEHNETDCDHPSPKLLSKSNTLLVNNLLQSPSSDSQSSYNDDVERDVNFMLNSSSALKDKFMTAPQSLSDMFSPDANLVLTYKITPPPCGPQIPGDDVSLSSSLEGAA